MMKILRKLFPPPPLRDRTSEWREMFWRYTEVVGRAEGVDFLDSSDWSPRQWEAIVALYADHDASYPGVPV